MFVEIQNTMFDFWIWTQERVVAVIEVINGMDL